MRIESTIKVVMKMKGITLATMSKMLGLSGYTAVQRRLNNGNITINNAIDMLDLLGYEIVVRESSTGRRRDDEIIITREDEVEI